MTRALPLDWTLSVDVPVESDLHRVVRDALARHPRDRRPIVRAVLGGLSFLAARPIALTGSLLGDEDGVGHVRVTLPRAARRTLRLVAATVPSRWRWRTEGEALVGQGPRGGQHVHPEDAPPGTLVWTAFAFGDEVTEVVLDGLPTPVRGLRRGEVHLLDVQHPGQARVTFRLRFDDEGLAHAAQSGLNTLLARIAVDHGAYGLHYDGGWSLDGDCLIGSYRATAEPDWASVLGPLIDPDGRPEGTDPGLASTAHTG